MKLMYRGISYQSTPTQVVLKESPIVARYRGSAYRLRQSEKSPVLPASLNLVNHTNNQEVDLISEQARETLAKRNLQTKQRGKSMLMRSSKAIGFPTV